MHPKTMTAREKAEFIKDRVSLPLVIDRYHHPGKRYGRTSCPFHDGKNDNLGYNARVYHCFVCGAKGSVIDFTMGIHKCDVFDAMRMLDADFNLGIEDLSEAERKKVEKAHYIREANRAIAVARRKKNDAAHMLFCRYRHWLEERRIHTKEREFALVWADQNLTLIEEGGDYFGEARGDILHSYHIVMRAEAGTNG